MNPGLRSSSETVDACIADSRAVLATLIRLLGDFDLAERCTGIPRGAETWPRGRAGQPARRQMRDARAIDQCRQSRFQPSTSGA
jgi:predicted RNA polymerase sigma factor